MSVISGVPRAGRFCPAGVGLRRCRQSHGIGTPACVRADVASWVHALLPYGSNLGSSSCLNGGVLLCRSPDYPMTRSPDLAALARPPSPLLPPSQIGVAFSDVIPTHPRLACTSGVCARLA